MPRSPNPRRRATLASLAAELKVSRTTISNIERNETNPTLSTIWRLAQALDYIMVVVNRSMEKVRSGGVQRSMREIAASALQDALTVFAEP